MIARVDKHLARCLPQADTYHVFAVGSQFSCNGAEVAIAGCQYIDLDFWMGKQHFQDVGDHLDIRCILIVETPVMEELYGFNGVFQQILAVFAKTRPIPVCPFGDAAAELFGGLDEDPRLKPAERFFGRDRQVFEVHKQGYLALSILFAFALTICFHAKTSWGWI